MQGSHTHIPGTNNVPRGYIVAAILSLLFMVSLCLVPALVLLFFYVSTFRSMCAVPNMAVFCSTLTSWFPGMSLTYFLNDLEMVYYYCYYYYYHYYHYHHHQTLACLMLTLNVETVLPLDACWRRLMPSRVMPICSMDVRSGLTLRLPD